MPRDYFAEEVGGAPSVATAPPDDAFAADFGVPPRPTLSVNVQVDPSDRSSPFQKAFIPLAEPPPIPEQPASVRLPLAFYVGAAEHPTWKALMPDMAGDQIIRQMDEAYAKGTVPETIARGLGYAMAEAPFLLSAGGAVEAAKLGRIAATALPKALASRVSFLPWLTQRVVHTGASTSLARLAESTVEGIEQGHLDPIEIASETGRAAAFGAALGVIGAAPTLPQRVLRGVLGGAAIAKVQGGGVEEMTANAVLFGAFEMMSGRVTMDRKFEAFRSAEQATADYLIAKNPALSPSQAKTMFRSAVAGDLRKAGVEPTEQAIVEALSTTPAKRLEEIAARIIGVTPETPIAPKQAIPGMIAPPTPPTLSGGVIASQAKPPLQPDTVQPPAANERAAIIQELGGSEVQTRFGTVGQLSDEDLMRVWEEQEGQQPKTAEGVATALEVEQAAAQAATSPKNALPEPSQAQKESGNYQKGHVDVQGLDISIEYPRGSIRSGVDKSGQPWSVTMAHHYGYIRGTEGKDAEQVDVFIGPDPASDQVFVVDQIKPESGAFDEHKALLGFHDETEARAGYLANYAKDWKGLGAITPMSMEQFKEWVTSREAKKPAAQAEVEPTPPAQPALPPIEMKGLRAAPARSVYDVERFRTVEGSPVITDGGLLELAPSDTDAQSVKAGWESKNPGKTSQSITLEEVNKVIPSTTDAAHPLGAPVKLVAMEGFIKEAALYQHPAVGWVALNGKYARYIAKRGYQLYATSDNTLPIRLVRDGKTAGVVMPLRDSNELAKKAGLLAPAETELESQVTKQKALERELRAAATGRQGGPGGAAEIGGYADLPPPEGDAYADQPLELAHLDTIQPIELPEIIALVKAISEHVPTLKRFPRALGRFYGKLGQIRLHPWVFLDQKAVDALREQAKTFEVEGKTVPKELSEKLDWVEQHWQPNLAVKVLAHEVGHLIDWLPDETLKRGNLIGRAISSLHQFMTGKFGELVNRQLRKELKALTQYWKPFDVATASDSFKAYRYSSKELYADFISVLLNDPASAKRLAPSFYQSFFDHLDAKPEVKQEYARLQRLLREPDDALLAEREDRILEGYLKADEIATVIRQKALARKKSFRFAVKDLLIADAALRELAKEKLGEGAQDITQEVERLALRNGVVNAELMELDRTVWYPMQAAGVLPTDVGLAIQLTRITKGDRSPLANPEGFTAETAQTQLDYLMRRLGPEKAANVERAAQGIRAWFRGLTAKYPGLFTPEQRQVMAENTYYAPFQVIDYLENFISAGFIQQEGTFKSIRNPFDALVLKGVSVVLAGEKNRITAHAMQGLLPYTTEADGLMPAPVTMAEGGLPRVKHKNGYDAILWKEDGKWVAAYAEPTVAKSFNRPDNRAMGATAQVLNVVLANPFWKKILITLSSGYQSVNALIRDPGRSWVNLGLIPFKGYGTPWGKRGAFPITLRRVRGQYHPVLVQMLREGALQPLFNELLKGKTEFDTELEAQTAKYGGADTEEARTMVQRVFGWFEFWGNVFESLPKIAGWRQLRANQLRARRFDPAERAYQTRTYLGTPTRRPGEGYDIYNNAWQFSEMFKEGWRSDAELARHPKTRVGWWLRTFLISVVPVIGGILAAAGYFGPEIRERMRKVSEYLKTNYHVLPVGEDASGKAITLTIALPDTQRFIHGLAWKLLSPLIDSLSDMREGKTPRTPDYSGKHFEQLFAFGAGALPSPAPMVEWYTALVTLMVGGEPRDWFRDQPILTEKERKAGGWDRWAPFLRWTINQTGFTKMALHAGPDSSTSLLERSVSFAPGLNRFLRVTDYGLTEELREAKESVESLESRTRLERERQVVEALRRGQSVREAMKEFQTPMQDRTAFRAAFRRLSMRQVSEPVINALLSAGSNEQKVAILSKWRESFDSDEAFKQAINNLRIEHRSLISRDVRKKLRDVSSILH